MDANTVRPRLLPAGPVFRVCPRPSVDPRSTRHAQRKRASSTSTPPNSVLAYARCGGVLAIDLLVCRCRNMFHGQIRHGLPCFRYTGPWIPKRHAGSARNRHAGSTAANRDGLPKVPADEPARPPHAARSGSGASYPSLLPPRLPTAALSRRRQRGCERGLRACSLGAAGNEPPKQPPTRRPRGDAFVGRCHRRGFHPWRRSPRPLQMQP